METITLHDRQFSLLYPEAEIQERVAELGRKLNEIYQNRELVILPVLNGAFVFAADLVRHLDVGPQLQFVRLSTYGGEIKSSKQVRDAFGLNTLRVRDKHVLIVEDIVDTGFTVNYLRTYLKSQNPASVAVACCLFKSGAFEGEPQERPEYYCYEIPNEFVVGYGLDYAQLGRELRGIYREIGLGKES